ncbi:MAG: Lrp/AsnC family transcriptional regulator [Nanoarchaeota archaeon]|nr:Lrp/AsnC family transcriptional regulator [Nanoarchaeota archaeon]
MIPEPDQKDRNILRELFDDARKPFSVIAKNVRASKEVVNYRVKRMLDSGLLSGFNTVIDIERLGWQVFFVYVRLRNIDDTQEQSIIESLKRHKNVAWLIRCIGNYDVVMKVFVRSTEEIDTILKGFESSYTTHIDSSKIEYVSEEHAVPFSFIYQTKEQTIHSIKKSTKERYELSKTEARILKELARNARLPLSDMATKLKLSREVLTYHLRKLEKEKIVLKYRPDFWPDQLGYNWYLITLKLGKMEEAMASQLKAYLLHQKNVTYFYKTIGESDLEVEVRVRTTEELSVILMELRSLLKTALKRQEILIVLKEHKYTYFPECLMETA